MFKKSQPKNVIENSTIVNDIVVFRDVQYGNINNKLLLMILFSLLMIITLMILTLISTMMTLIVKIEMTLLIH